MKKFALLSLLAVGAFAAEWSGTIVDEKCGAKHADASEASQKCVNGCIKGGSAPVFATGDKVLKFSNPDAIKEHYGHKVTINGKLDKKTNMIMVKSVKMAS
ncbi:MAG: hypothetical protein K2X03_21935 [Bryobacteraceae bacterium]|nr:hypothetical protein [Bryobacteraceae bacterium]